MDRPEKPGTLIFATVFLALSVILSLQIDSQTTWSSRHNLTSQPRFWPATGLIMMVAFGAMHLWQYRGAGLRGSGAELWIWIRGLEFAAWFLGYVFLVPQFGYLPASIVVAVALTFRSGFRGMRWLAFSVTLAFGIVVLFRGLLRVHVPGGKLYHALPEGISNFMLTWL